MTLPNSVLSRFGNALVLSQHGRTPQIRDKWEKVADELRLQNTTIDQEYSLWQEKARELKERYSMIEKEK